MNVMGGNYHLRNLFNDDCTIQLPLQPSMISFPGVIASAGVNELASLSIEQDAMTHGRCEVPTNDHDGVHVDAGGERTELSVP